MARGVRRSIVGIPLVVGLLAASPAGFGLDVHLQALPPAPGLRPSQGLDPLAGVKEALSCGLAFLDGAKACGLSGLEQVSSPFAVSFDPMFCRLTMRFDVGQLIDGLIGDWISGALARIGTPNVGLLCLLGVGPQFCGANSGAGSMMNPAPITPQSALLQKMRPGAQKEIARQQRDLQETLNAALGERDAPTPQDNRTPATPPTPATDDGDNGQNADEKTGLERLLR